MICEKCKIKITIKNFWLHRHDTYIDNPTENKKYEVKK